MKYVVTFQRTLVSIGTMVIFGDDQRAADEWARQVAENSSAGRPDPSIHWSTGAESEYRVASVGELK